MSAEPKRATNTELWTQWEGQVINGAFALRRLLGCSHHSAVFLTEHKANGLTDAAIKFVRADAVQANAQLAHWEAAAARSHPHLIRLFDIGRHQTGGQEFVYVVMEHADQTLAQILHRRALSPDEARELLRPTLDALAFLHRNQLVHAQLKPSNFLAVGDHLKLSSDSVRPIRLSAHGAVRTSSYDPPELKEHGVSPAGDIWSLGMTLVEALTQRPLPWTGQQCETVSLPANFPAQFLGTVRRCLSVNPADRPTVVQLRAPYDPAPPAQSVSGPQSASSHRPSAHEVPREVTPPQSSTKRRSPLPAIAVTLLLALAVWAGVRLTSDSQAQLQPTVVPASAPAAPAAIVKPAVPEPSSPVERPSDQTPVEQEAASLSVLHEAIPDVPPAIQAKIQGRIYVTVRVLVDPSGAVVGALLENPGSSKYFARLADNAAREWQFAPADSQGNRVWLVRFEFTRDGVATRAIAQ